MRFRTQISAAMAMAAFASLALLATGGQAKSRVQDFIIAGNDGYGTQECLVSQSSCGRVVADAWCEAKGFKSAQTYRAALPEELTGSVSDAPRSRGPEAFIITCRD